MTTYCGRCLNMTRESKNAAPWRWMCLKARREPGYGYVCEGIWESFPPYHFCKDLNRNGECEEYSEAPEEQWIGRTNHGDN